MESDDSVNQLNSEYYNIKSNVVEQTLKDTTSLTSKKGSKSIKDSNEKQNLHNNFKLFKKPPETSSRTYNSHSNFQYQPINENVKSFNLTTDNHVDKANQLNLPTQVKETEVNLLISNVFLTTYAQLIRNKSINGINISFIKNCYYFYNIYFIKILV